MKFSIQILPSNQIDKDKWNHCIEEHSNGFIYATYDYINTIADNWHGVIAGDYEAVMPLPWRKKGWIRYVYTPPFMQQLGLSGNIENINVVEAIQSFCSYFTYNFNYSNIDIIERKEELTMHTNLILPLNNTITNIQTGYSKTLLRNIEKAGKSLTVIQGSIDNAIRNYEKFQGDKMPHVKQKDYQHLFQALTMLNNNGQVICKEALNSNGESIAYLLCLKDNKRIYNLLPSSTEEGKASLAMHLLLNTIITKHAESNLLFDFEGSDIPGVKQFYLQFGATEQPYYRLHQNNLPFWLKWMKQ